MQTHKPICVIGSIVYDFVMNLPRFPAVGETVLGDRFSTFIGGKGLNQAVQIFRLGAPMTFFGRVGDDRLGKEVIEVLEAQGFPTAGIRIAEGDQTATGMIYVIPGGVNMIGGVPTANMNFTVEEIDAEVGKAVESASFVSLQLEIPTDTNERILRLARKAGVPTVLNAAPFRKLPDSFHGLVDYWVVNEIEAGQFFGVTIREHSDCRALCSASRIRTGEQVWVVTLGEKGAAVVDTSGVHEIPGISVCAVDSTGAGDSFTGAFVVGLAEGKSPVDAAVFANRVAALSVTKLGGMSGLPTRAELERSMSEARTK